MTRTTNIIISTALFSLMLSPIAFAEEATGTRPLQPYRDLKRDIKETRVDNRAEVKNASTSAERREVRQENREEIKDLRKQALDAKRKGIIERHIKNMAERYRAAIERLERLANRSEERIVKLEEKGFALDEAKSKLAEARAAIEAAKQSAADVRTQLETAIASEDPKAAMESIRETAKKVAEYLKEAHAKLVEAVKAIKGSRESNAGNATTTNTQ